MRPANQTSPGILEAGRAVTRCSAAPKLLHWQAALHIVIYFKSTRTYGFTSQRDLGNGVQLELYVDEPSHGRSCSCMITPTRPWTVEFLMLGTAGQ